MPKHHLLFELVKSRGGFSSHAPSRPFAKSTFRHANMGDFLPPLGFQSLQAVRNFTSHSRLETAMQSPMCIGKSSHHFAKSVNQDHRQDADAMWHCHPFNDPK
jgi:hypothetical protein